MNFQNQQPAANAQPADNGVPPQPAMNFHQQQQHPQGTAGNRNFPSVARNQQAFDSPDFAKPQPQIEMISENIATMKEHYRDLGFEITPSIVEKWKLDAMASYDRQYALWHRTIRIKMAAERENRNNAALLRGIAHNRAIFERDINEHENQRPAVPPDGTQH